MDITEEKSIVNGVISRIVYSNNENGFRVFRVNSTDYNREITIAGKGTSIRVGETVRAIGTFEKTKYGHQLTAASITVQNAVTEDGLAQSICGLVSGLGIVRAKNVIRYFGGPEGFIKAFDKNESPVWPGKSYIPQSVFDDLYSQWKETRIEREIESQLASLELTPGTRNKLRAKYGSEAIQVVLTDPYRIAFEVEGIGFLTTDDIALKAGVGVDSDKRIDAAIFHAIQSDATESGHTMSSLDDVLKVAVNIFMKRTPPSSFSKNPRKACKDSVDRLLEKDLIVSVETEAIDQFGDPYTDYLYATKFLYEAEMRIAEGLKRISDSMSEAPDMNREYEDERLTDEQNSAVKAVIEKGITVITGGPGVGKTTTCRSIVDIAERSSLSIKLCAPTARAAKRLSESTNKEATTIHRLLEPQYGGAFARNSDNKIEADLILADEMSMTDSLLFASLIDAIPDGCRLVLVGDHNQLPPVGSGAPFRDIIRTEKINIARLTKIHRQAEGSAIVVGSHSILKGYSPRMSTPGDRTPGCLHMVNVKTEDAAKVALHILAGVQEDLDCDPWDVMVLAPMRKGASGVQEINKRIQNFLNPPSDDKPELVYGSNESERIFRIGDKVRQTKNDYQRGVVNGDLGRIVHVEPRSTLKQDTVVSVDFGSGVGVVNYKREDLSHLQLSYCGTIHSVQGSEAPVVVLILTDAHYVMLTRTLIYTAVTRAKRGCIIVGSDRAVAMASRNAKDDGRRTLLSSFLNDCFSNKGIENG
jgi:exodeoxyribonuclease V alpha subunit